MGSKLLDYIILALLFVIAINLLMGMFEKRSGKEEMSQILLPEEENAAFIEINTPPDAGSQPITHTLASAEEGPIITDKVNSALDQMLQYPAQAEQQVQQVQQAQQVQQVPQVQQADPNKFTKEEILEYQDSMFEFNENINQSSAGVDMVDKLNQLYTSRNNEMSGFQGKTIGEVYDGLTQSIIDRKKKCVNAGCLIPPLVDNVSKIESYIMSTNKGKYFRHGLLYEDDDVQTGSKFYNEIEATDSDFEEHSVF